MVNVGIIYYNGVGVSIRGVFRSENYCCGFLISVDVILLRKW